MMAQEKFGEGDNEIIYQLRVSQLLNAALLMSKA